MWTHNFSWLNLLYCTFGKLILQWNCTIGTTPNQTVQHHVHLQICYHVNKWLTMKTSNQKGEIYNLALAESCMTESTTICLSNKSQELNNVHLCFLCKHVEDLLQAKIICNTGSSLIVWLKTSEPEVMYLVVQRGITFYLSNKHLMSPMLGKRLPFIRLKMKSWKDQQLLHLWPEATQASLNWSMWFVSW